MAVASLGTSLHAQQRPSDPQDQPQATQQQEMKAFTGKIVKEGEKLVLKDTTANVSYQLDDQEKAKPFQGKHVKVNGKLDTSSNVIHVDSIEAAAS